MGAEALPLRPVYAQNKTSMIDISKKTRLLAWLSAVPFLIVIFLFEILPLLAVAANSVFKEDELSLGNYIEILLSKFFMGSFRVSFSISAATSVIALLVALPAAVVLRRMPGRIQQFVWSAPILAQISPASLSPLLLSSCWASAVRSRCFLAA